MSKSSVSFMMTTLERPCHILSYSYPFKVLFALLENLLKKLQFIHTSQKPKTVFILEKISSKVGHLIMKNTLSPTLGKITSLTPFFSYIQRRPTSLMHHRVKWGQCQAQFLIVNIFIFPCEFSNSWNLDSLRLYFKSQLNFCHSKSCRENR